MVEVLVVVMVVDEVFKVSKDGAEEEAGLLREAAVREGFGSTEATPTSPGGGVAAAEGVGVVCEAEGAGETSGPVRDGVVEVTAGAVVWETDLEVEVGVTTVGAVVAPSREGRVVRAEELGDTAAVVRGVEEEEVVVVTAEVGWTGTADAEVTAAMGERIASVALVEARDKAL